MTLDLSVGTGAIKLIPDHVAQRIVDSMCPHLAIGNFDNGVMGIVVW